MQNPEEIKRMVREKYAAIAQQRKEANEKSCCGAGGCDDHIDYTIFSDDYSGMEGYVAEADLGLGCGLPTEFAQIKRGDTVVDLGSGAGNDCFVARARTGPEGEVIGIDMTEAMIEKARANARKLGFDNVSFRLGEIEDIPLGDNCADVVISNCVLNLVPDKRRAFSEIYRILKPGGHFSISDVVTRGALPEGLQKAAEMYAGCVAGAIDIDDYLAIIGEAGFEEVHLQKEKEVRLPRTLLANFLSDEEITDWLQAERGIYSITVFGRKPATDDCCRPESGCC